MKVSLVLLSIAVCLWYLSDQVSSVHVEHETCKREWTKVGCFKDKDRNLRALKHILITDRDSGMRAYSGQRIDWKNWKAYVHGFACRCAAAAKARGYKMFGLQFAGECWAGPDEEKRYNMYGAVSGCFDHLSNPLQPCNDKIEDECMGLRWENYVYRIKQDGGYTPWSPWSECSVTCGTGVHMRKRTCANPAPYNGGKDCRDLGPSSETKECNTQLCPSPCKPPKKFDVGVAVDVSTSIGLEQFKKVNSFLEKFVAQFDISANETHIGMLKFSTYPTLVYSPTDPKYQSVAAQEEAARNIHYSGGGTRTDRALVMANKQFFNDEADRKNVPNVLIVLTDGNTNRDSDPYWQVLAPLKEKNVRIMAVGVGSRIDDVELKIIALNNDKHKIHVSDFDHLIANMDELLDEACKE